MLTKLFGSAFASSLLMATALSSSGAGDMTHERALNIAKEPHNWLLHHGNYQGHRFSQLKEITTETVRSLKPIFSVALGGLEGAGTELISLIVCGPDHAVLIIYAHKGAAVLEAWAPRRHAKIHRENWAPGGDTWPRIRWSACTARICGSI
jgi:hypothetical protein